MPLNYFPSSWQKEMLGPGAVLPPEEGCTHCLSPTHPPALHQRLTSRNLITLLTCPICSMAGREGFNYICTGNAVEPQVPISQGPDTAPRRMQALRTIMVPQHLAFRTKISSLSSSHKHTHTASGGSAAGEGF